MVFVVPHALGVEPTSVDVVSQSGWQYLYGPERVPDSDLHASLVSSRFYENWMTPEFRTNSVAGVDWQNGTLPLGFASSANSLVGPLNTVLGDRLTPGRSRTTFLRNTFTIPDDLLGPYGIELTIDGGAQVYVDGEVVARANCCYDDQGEGFDRSLQLFDSARGSQRRDYFQIDGLSSGEHVVAVALLDYPATPQTDPSAIGLDLRLFSQGNVNYLVNRKGSDWRDPKSWLFGLPRPDQVAVVQGSGTATVLGDEAISGLVLPGRNFVRGSGMITLNGNGENSLIEATGELAVVYTKVELASAVDVFVGQDTRSLDVQHIQLNGQTLHKLGGGKLYVNGANATPNGEPGVIDIQEGSLGGFVHGDVISSGGAIDVDDYLTVTGSASAPVIVDLDAVISGDGQGDLQIEQLTVNVSNRFLPSFPATYELFPNWDSVSAQEFNLPNVGLMDWDTSRISEGILGIKRSDRQAACDLDQSGSCITRDLNLLMSAIFEKSNETEFDLNEDGVVDLADRDQWLVLAGESYGVSPLLTGDSNLDGVVDQADLNRLGVFWESERQGIWSQTDFNADGYIDAQDLNLLARNWQQEVQRVPSEQTAAVPEPSALILSVVCLLPLFHRRATR